MLNGNIKAVFFDAADTLFFVRDGVESVYADVASKYRSRPDNNAVKQAFIRAFSTAPPLAFTDVSEEERQILEKSWWKEVVYKVFKVVGMFEQFDEYFDDLFETFRIKAWRLFPETKAVLSALKERGYILVVISNFDSRIYEVSDNLGITDFFDSFIISSESGFAKPSGEIFDLALKKFNLTPSECVHIGDSKPNDYDGAAALGINALLLDRDSLHSDRDGINTIHSLSELLDLL